MPILSITGTLVYCALLSLVIAVGAVAADAWPLIIFAPALKPDKRPDYRTKNAWPWKAWLTCALPQSAELQPSPQPQ